MTFFSFEKYDIPTCFDIDNKDNLDFVLSTIAPKKSLIYANRETGAYFGPLDNSDDYQPYY